MTNKSIPSMLQQAQILLGQNLTDEARDIYRKICALDRNNDTAWMMLGNLHGAAGNISEAERCCKKAIAINPGMVNAHANLGNALMTQHRYKEAAASFKKATQLQPDLAPAWFMLGKACQNLTQWSEGGVAFSKAINLKPDWLEARLMLGNVSQAAGNPRHALQQYEEIILRQADNIEAHYRLGISLTSLGDTNRAEEEFRRVLELQPVHAPALNSLSMVLTSRGQTDEALECCERALTIRPDDINAACMAANINEQLGDVAKACDYLQPHIDAGTLHVNLALAFAAVSKGLEVQDQAISMMEKVLVQGQLSNTDQRNLRFTLGKLCDSTQQYDRAFKHYEQGNALRSTQFSVSDYRAEIDAIINIQSAEFFDSAPRASNGSDRPVFIVGMPRSGTSLVEQILASHPRVHGAGELAEIGRLAHYLPETLATDKPYPRILENINRKTLDQCADQYLDYLNALDADALRVTDKMPGNFYYLGLIELLFPNARIIHCMRNPLDSCLSCYFQDFFQRMDWCYDQKNLVVYYQGYEKLMQHWEQTLTIPIMNVSYEALVAGQESVSRNLIEFCGLEWNDDCLQFHKNRRFVPTASYDQIRQPIYTKSVDRWKNYASHIEPLRKILGV